jgi:hypothetical protein
VDSRIAALGFAPHSGWAAVVGLEGADPPTRVVVRERVEMADPRHAESKQPYHAVEDLPVAEAARRLRAWEQTAEFMASDAIQQIVSRLADDGCRVIGFGILESAGRKGASLEAILRSHALIHTADGEHFRSALASAATRCGMTAARVRSRGLEAAASTAIRKTPQTLHQAIGQFGREVGPPWGADQKAAALLAWLLLAQHSAAGPGAIGRG